MAVRGLVPNFQLADSSDEDEAEDRRKPKVTGKVLRVFDEDKQTFKRLRLRNKDRGKMSADPAASKTFSFGSLNETGRSQQNQKKRKREGSENFGSVGNFMSPPNRNRATLFSPVPELPEVEMTPTNRYGRKSFEESSPRRKRPSLEDKRTSNSKKLQLSSSTEDDFIPESPEIQEERKMKSKKTPNKQPQFRGKRPDKGGFTPNSKFAKNVRTPNQRFKNGKTPTPNFRQNRSPAYLNKSKHATPKLKNDKWKSGKRKDNKDLTGEKQNVHSQKYSSVLDQTPEFMRVKDEDSVKQERKERRRKRQIAMCKKTKRGQPVMKGRIELMLEKIKADLCNQSQK